MQYRDNYQYTYISTATTTQVAIGLGQLIRIVVGTTSAGAITIADSTTTTTPIISTLVASVPVGSYDFSINFGQGLRIVTAGASLITVVYSVNT